MHWIALQPLCEAPTPLPAAATQDEAAQCAALGWWALQFTPRVALVDEAVLLEVSGSERLFGGRAALLQLLLEPPLEIMGWAQGATSLLALACLRTTPTRRRVAPAAEPVPDALPLHTLSAAREHLATLSRLGCNHWGDLRALPRGGVVRRFGAGLLDALDCAYGLKPEAHTWLVAPEVFEVKLELHALVEQAGALMFVAQRLLAQLQAWLQARQSGVLALQWTWFFDARRSHAQGDAAASDGLLIRTAQATRDMTHLARLTAEQLGQCTLATPVHSLRLRSIEVVPLPTASASLLIEERLQGDSLHQLVERLGARLGPQQVVWLQPQAEHRPEYMQSLEPASAMQRTAGRKRAGKSSTTDAVPNAALYPTWLLERPLRLALQGSRPLYQGALQLLVGPQRLEVMGWAQIDAPAAALRDYFIALSPHAGLLWVYRERLPRGQASDMWFLHGIYA
jgi:protein ImuB